LVGISFKSSCQTFSKLPSFVLASFSIVAVNF